MKCPICGTQMERMSTPYEIPIAGSPVEVLLKGWRCGGCQNQVGDNAYNNKAMVRAKKKAVEDRAHSILSNIKAAGIRFSEIERRFLLPERTLSKWYTQETKPSATAVALLRMLDAFPWLYEAAGAGMETEAAQTVAREYYQDSGTQNLAHISEPYNYNVIETELRDGMLTRAEPAMFPIPEIFANQEELYEG